MLLSADAANYINHIPQSWFTEIMVVVVCSQIVLTWWSATPAPPTSKKSAYKDRCFGPALEVLAKEQGDWFVEKIISHELAKVLMHNTVELVELDDDIDEDYDYIGDNEDEDEGDDDEDEGEGEGDEGEGEGEDEGDEGEDEGDEGEDEGGEDDGEDASNRDTKNTDPTN